MFIITDKAKLVEEEAKGVGVMKDGWGVSPDVYDLLQKELLQTSVVTGEFVLFKLI